MIVERSARAAFFLFLFFVAWQTLTPDPEHSRGGLAFARWIANLLFDDVAKADKVAHFCAHAILGFLAALGRIRLFGRARYGLAALIAYGACLEYLQGLGGVRAAEWVDAAMNAAGAISGFAIATLLRNALGSR